MPKHLLFTPRLLKEIWRTLLVYIPGLDQAEIVSEPIFLAHFSQLDLNPSFFWTDQSTGLTYGYDLRLNMVQVNPTVEPYSNQVEQVNKQLWKVLPPHLLDENNTWTKAWLRALSTMDSASLHFIIEQGFDINTTDQKGRTALLYAAGFYGGEFSLVKLLVESGASFTIPGNTIEILIEEGIKSATNSAEAHQAREIAHYLRNSATHCP